MFRASSLSFFRATKRRASQSLKRVSSEHSRVRSAGTDVPSPRVHPCRSLSHTVDRPFDVKRELIKSAVRTSRFRRADKPFENVLLVGVQHMLGTTADMFGVLHKYGLSRAILGGKRYSTHDETVENWKTIDPGYQFVPHTYQLGLGSYDLANQATIQAVWSLALKAMEEKKPELLIILDDGAQLLKSTPGKLFNGMKHKPHAVVGIEQTRGGTNGQGFDGLPFPVINVAGAYVKSIEYEGVVDKVTSVCMDILPTISEGPIKGDSSIGVIGYGNVGKVLVGKLQQQGLRNITVHDPNRALRTAEVPFLHFLPDLVRNSDVIFSCTGTDVTADELVLQELIKYSGKRKWLVSTSSEDREFNTLLRYIQAKTKKHAKTPCELDDIEFQDLGIKRGGFPANFDNQKHSVDPRRIWPTRAALMAACFMAKELQACPDLVNSTAIHMLCEYKQMAIINQYRMLNPEDKFFVGLDNSVAGYLSGGAEDKEQALLQYIVEESEGLRTNVHGLFDSCHDRQVEEDFLTDEIKPAC